MIAALVPAYNADRHLRDCLDSLLAQTEPVEIWCCDDGSADTTRAILMEYSLRCPRMHFLTQRNRGVCAALNRLLDELPDDIEYFMIVDADDYVHPKMAAVLQEALLKTGSDVAECGIVRVPDGACQPGGLSLDVTGTEQVIDNLSVYLLKRTAPSTCWINKNAKLYRRAAVRSLRFREGLAFEEDYFYGCEVNAAISRKVIVPYGFYAYRDNPASVTHVLNHRRYFESASLRVRLTCEVFLATGRIPLELEREFRKDLTKDIYRMCIRKNLKKNRDCAERQRIFQRAGDLLKGLEHDFGFVSTGLNPIQWLIWNCCRQGHYTTASALVYLT